MPSVGSYLNTKIDMKIIMVDSEEELVIIDPGKVPGGDQAAIIYKMQVRKNV